MRDLFFRWPRLTILVIALLTIGGLTALDALPRQEDPEVVPRYGDVKVYLPAASAMRVESLVTEKIEAALSEVDQIKHLTSRSQTGFSAVYIELDDDVTDSDPVWTLIRSKMTSVRLPDDASVPEVTVGTTAAFTYLVGLTWHLDEKIQLGLLRRLARELEQRVVAFPGTREVQLYGVPEEEIEVSVPLSVLASKNLTTQDIATAIRGADVKVAAGQVQSERSNLVLEVDGELESLDQIRRIPLHRSAGGELLRVGDVAQVSKRLREPQATRVLVRGKPTVVVAIKMADGRRVDRWVAGLNDLLDRFRATMPEGVEAETLFDQSRQTAQRLGSLLGNLLLGAGLVVAVLFMTMGWRTALLVASALPLTLLAVMIVLGFLKVPLHQVSLTGLIIALGLLIDNAIVSIDEYHKGRRRGLDRGHAIRETVGRLFVPLLASSATTALTFLPLTLMPGGAGEFVGSLGITVVLSVCFSFMLSLTVLPAIAAYLDRSGTATGEAGGPRSLLHDGLSLPRLSKVYGRLVAASLARPSLGILAAIVIPASGFVAAGSLVPQFFPVVDRDQFQLQLKLPDNASLEQTAEAVQVIRGILDEYVGVRDGVFFLGENPPRVFYNVTLADDPAPNFAAGFVETKSADDTFEVLRTLPARLSDALPNAFILALPYEQGPPGGAPIEVRLSGPDLEVLSDLGAQIRRILSGTRNVTYTRATINGGRPRLVLEPKLDEATFAGFTPVDLANALNSTLDGVIGGSVIEGTEELPVRVRTTDIDRTSVERVVSVAIHSPSRDVLDGRVATVASVPLSVLGDFKLVPATPLVTRRDSERTNTVQAFVTPFTLPSVALADFRQRLAESDFRAPPGYRMSFGGETEKSGEAQSNLSSVFAPLALLLVGGLVLAFNSFTAAAVIVAVAILSIGGGLLSLWLFGIPLGFIAVVGCMGLVGLAINDSIVVLSALRHDPAAVAGDLDAVRRVVMEGTRHVLSTTLTTIGGFAPLIIWGGLFWPPLAVAISGGMIGATMLALFFVPPVFVLMSRVRRRPARPA
jgi:multidrug efflux pump subunit AcrB